ncbi:thrombomodulin-like [Hyperolius riggenbachi]|uniref:thrombomodulin-like n=1 Tax=Hyperolius riggenbachi TaxID=752182 RepID=UPI0035A35A83
MLLLHITWAVITSAQLALQDPVDELMTRFLCTDHACYSIVWTSRSYARANRDCSAMNGHLVTVKDSLEASVIARLISNVRRDDVKVWIGLERQSGCTDLLQPLRGHTWVTGDSNTNYNNWSNQDQQCGTRCVTVNKHGTWEETDCKFKPDGYLCELDLPASCQPLRTADGTDAIYYHDQFGIGSSGGQFYPSGTNANISSFHDPLLCESIGNKDVKWSSGTRGAWSCLTQNGGCEHEYVEVDGTPTCQCPSGSPLNTDKRTCPKFCDPNPCSNICHLTTASPGFLCSCPQGYHLKEDGRTCEDINECTEEPDICEHQCNNTLGSFLCTCRSGFKPVVDPHCEDPDGCAVHCQDIDECEGLPCEHNCENFPGGYDCSCDEGFLKDRKDSKKCKMICNSPTCEPECDDEDKCKCSKGYILEEDNKIKVCVDVDECEYNPCKGSCINLYGTYKCTCPKGYTVEGSGCVVLQDVPDSTEQPSGEPTTPPSPEPIPLTTIFSVEPTILLGILIGIVAMLAALIAMLCGMARRRYTDQLDLDYRIKDSENVVILQQVKTIPH